MKDRQTDLAIAEQNTRIWIFALDFIFQCLVEYTRVSRFVYRQARVNWNLLTSKISTHSGLPTTLGARPIVEVITTARASRKNTGTNV